MATATAIALTQEQTAEWIVKCENCKRGRPAGSPIRKLLIGGYAFELCAECVDELTAAIPVKDAPHVVSCNQEWQETSDFDSEAEARAFMAKHAALNGAKHARFRLWRLVDNPDCSPEPGRTAA